MTLNAFLPFSIIWAATFVPSWLILIKLLGRSIVKDERRLLFWLLFLFYRLLIALPYIVLLVFYKDDINDFVRSAAIGFVIGGLIFSIIRWFKTESLIRGLWFVYGFFYDGLNRFYPYKNLIRLVSERLPSQKGLTILDIGCGTGNMTRMLADKYPTSLIIATDSSPSMLRSARKKLAAYDNVEIIVSSAEDFLSAYQEQADLIIMSNVIYALDDRCSVWASIARILSPKGKVIFTNSDKPGNWVIVQEHLKNDRFLKLLHPRLLGVFLIDTVISQIAELGQFNFLSLEDLKKEVGEHGLIITNTERCYGGSEKGVNVMGDITRS